MRWFFNEQTYKEYRRAHKRDGEAWIHGVEAWNDETWEKCNDCKHDAQSYKSFEWARKIFWSDRGNDEERAHQKYAHKTDADRNSERDENEE